MPKLSLWPHYGSAFIAHLQKVNDTLSPPLASFEATLSALRGHQGV